MEALQSELTHLLGELHPDTRIGLRSFSSSNRKNHKTWDEFGTNLVRIGNDGYRQSAIDFVNTLEDPSPTEWGGTDPWDAIDSAFDDNETDTLYFLSDGKPNKDRNRGSWSTRDEERTAQHYADRNKDRSEALRVNTTALGLESVWMERLAALTGGEYNQVDSMKDLNQD